MKNIAIVTGASSGMGKDFAMYLSNHPNLDEIWIIARRKDRLKELEKATAKNPVKLRSLVLDLEDSLSYSIIQKLLCKERPDISYLVNGAGLGAMGLTEEISWEEQQKLLDINVRAFTCIMRLCLPYIPEKGHIIALCSGSAFIPQPGFASYAASKAYVLSFCRALDCELKPRKIYVTCVCPGPVETEFFQNMDSEISPFKKMFMAKSKRVVKKALRDAEHGKKLSLYGLPMNLYYTAVNILPWHCLLNAANRII